MVLEQVSPWACVLLLSWVEWALFHGTRSWSVWLMKHTKTGEAVWKGLSPPRQSLGANANAQCIINVGTQRWLSHKDRNQHICPYQHTE